MAHAAGNKVSGMKIRKHFICKPTLRIFIPELQPLVLPDMGELNTEL